MEHKNTVFSTAAFCNRAEVLFDAREYAASFCPEDKAMIAQEATGPVCLVIGKFATDEQLLRLSRYTTTRFDDLLSFRDMLKYRQCLETVSAN